MVFSLQADSSKIVKALFTGPVTRSVRTGPTYLGVAIGIRGSHKYRCLGDLPMLKPMTLHGTAICTYIDPSNHPNVGIYGIHGVSGKQTHLLPFNGLGIQRCSTGNTEGRSATLQSFWRTCPGFQWCVLEPEHRPGRASNET